MKPTLKVLTIVFIFFAIPVWAAPKPAASVRVLSTKRYVFQFKVEKELIGGTVDILDAEKNLLKTEKILQTKNIVDFFELRAGSYVVRIRKGTQEFIFEYANIE